MRPNDPCLDTDRLLALSRGELSPDEQETVCHHLSHCPACERRLEAIEDPHGGVLANLRQFAGKRPLVDPSEYRGLQERARGIRIGALTPHTAQGQPAPAADRLPRPTRLGKYELGEELGGGGMGVVYRACHTRLGREFAVKVIRPEYAHHPTMVARFLREARALGGLAHPNIVAATDADEADGRPYLVMELIDGLDLETLMARCGPLPVAAACEIIRQAAVGLQAVHEKSRVHRDLKPSNLMLSAGGVVKVLDLGLAGILTEGGSAGQLTASRHVMGTVDYMAPEQWSDSHRVDIRADVYSLGCTLYKLLVGAVPFAAAQYGLPGRKELAHAQAPRPSARAARPEVSPELDAVVRRMMAADPAERYPTPRAAAEALAPFAGAVDGLVAAAREQATQRGLAVGPMETGIHQGRTPASDTPAPRGRRRRWVAAASVLLAAIGGLAWAVAAGRQGPAEDPGPQPGVWYDALRREPRPLFVENPRFNHFFQLDRNVGELRVDSPNTSLLGLARTDRAGYRIQLGIRQTRWDGGIGLFFGFHDDVIRGKPGVKYQLLELCPDPRPAARGFLLKRSWRTLEDHQGRLRLAAWTGFDSAVLDRPTDGQESTLIIEVRSPGLVRVFWDGKPLSELVRREYNATLSEADYVGWFGVYNCRSTSVFTNAKLLLFNGERQ